jgi:hypothetical protein
MQVNIENLFSGCEERSSFTGDSLSFTASKAIVDVALGHSSKQGLR